MADFIHAITWVIFGFGALTAAYGAVLIKLTPSGSAMPVGPIFLYAGIVIAAAGLVLRFIEWLL